MINKNLFLYLVGVIALISIGVNIFLYQKVIKLSDKHVLYEITEDDTGASSFTDSGEQFPEQSKDSNIGVIKELEYQLKAAEEELDIANEHLAEVLEDHNRETGLTAGAPHVWQDRTQAEGRRRPGKGHFGYSMPNRFSVLIKGIFHAVSGRGYPMGGVL